MESGRNLTVAPDLSFTTRLIVDKTTEVNIGSGNHQKIRTISDIAPPPSLPSQFQDMRGQKMDLMTSMWIFGLGPLWIQIREMQRREFSHQLGHYCRIVQFQFSIMFN